MAEQCVVKYLCRLIIANCISILIDAELQKPHLQDLGANPGEFTPMMARIKFGRCKTVKATPVGFEPTQGDPIGLAGRRLSHSAKVSMMHHALCSPTPFCCACNPQSDIDMSCCTIHSLYTHIRMPQFLFNDISRQPHMRLSRTTLKPR